MSQIACAHFPNSHMNSTGKSLLKSASHERGREEQGGGGEKRERGEGKRRSTEQLVVVVVSSFTRTVLQTCYKENKLDTVKTEQARECKRARRLEHTAKVSRRLSREILQEASLNQSAQRTVWARTAGFIQPTSQSSEKTGKGELSSKSLR